MNNYTFARSRAQRITINIIGSFTILVIGAGIVLVAIAVVTGLVGFGSFDLG